MTKSKKQSNRESKQRAACVHVLEILSQQRRNLDTAFYGTFYTGYEKNDARFTLAGNQDEPEFALTWLKIAARMLRNVCDGEWPLFAEAIDGRGSSAFVPFGVLGTWHVEVHPDTLTLRVNNAREALKGSTFV